MFDSDKIAREKPGPGSEAERVTEGQGFQRFQLRLSGFKPIQTRDNFIVGRDWGRQGLFF